MSVQKLKGCPRCNKTFECNPGHIAQCQCHGIVLSAEQNAWMEQKYTGCLCSNCLKQLALELDLFKEKYIFR